MDGAPLGYLEYLPPGYGDGERRPLLVFLHGSGERGDGSAADLRNVFKLGIPQLIQDDEWPESRPFVVLAPQYGFQRGEDCLLADDVDAFLRFAVDHYEADEERVYLTGVSCGAIGAWDYLAEHGDGTVAGAVLVAGHAVDALAEAGCALGRVPVWAFHGEADDIVPKRYIEEPVERLKACDDPPPEDVRLTLFPGVGHDAWDPAYDATDGDDIYAWLLGHRRD
ncbi:MAG: dienelactone hydrolase family protein [Thermoleophilia bacterium]|nr:dienelactone hydrolase family protein [Thermoleophilia bacterium]